MKKGAATLRLVCSRVRGVTDAMLNYRALGRLPDVIAFTRGGRTLTAIRKDLGLIRIQDRRLWIADPLLVDAAPPLPVRPPGGAASVHTYLWDHPRGPVHVCVVVRFRRQRWAAIRRLAVRTDARPDLRGGVIVDSGEVAIQSAGAVRLTSGPGDGYYPVYAAYNFGVFVQAVIVDFEVWQVRRVVLMPGQELDEFGIVREVPPADAEP
jgi:hypothetical protein